MKLLRRAASAVLTLMIASVAIVEVLMGLLLAGLMLLRDICDDGASWNR